MYPRENQTPEFVGATWYDKFQADEAAGHQQVAGIEVLPNAAGVYLFFGDRAEHDLPLYIGKSVAIRTRVLSHFREPSEARMMAQVRRIEHIRTAGEIGALLLESRLIKERQPLYNVRLRRSRDLCSWKLQAGSEVSRPTLVYSRDVEFSKAPDLYGLFSSAGRAKEFMRGLAQEHRLCLTTLGLEAPSRRGCFGLQIGRCGGVCVGREPVAAHTERLRVLLQEESVQQWPYAGPVGLVERDGEWSQTHVIDGWRHVRTEDSLGRSDPPSAEVVLGFDLDSYRILVGPLLKGEHLLVPICAT